VKDWFLYSVTGVQFVALGCYLRVESGVGSLYPVPWESTGGATLGATDTHRSPSYCLNARGKKPPGLVLYI